MLFSNTRPGIKSAPLFQKIEGDVSWIIQIQCRLVSDILEESSELSQEVQEHIIQWFLNPDPKSPFGKKTKIPRSIIKRFPSLQPGIIPSMRMLGYNGLIALYNNEVIGHAFFQKHKKETGDELHLFSIAVAGELQRRWIGTMIGKTFVELWRKPEEKIEKVRIGGGGDADVVAIFKKMDDSSEKLGITPSADFFITFIDRRARLVDTAIQPVKT